MNTRKWFGVVIVVLLATFALASVTNAQGPAPRSPHGGGDGLPITYQGQLKSSGTAYTGICDMQFGLWDDATTGNQKGITQTVTANVTNGLFTIELNTGVEFGTSGFDGNLRWFAITTRCPSGSGTYTKLTPRQKLTYAPMALALPGFFTQQVATSPNIIGGMTGNGVTLGVYGATISGGGYAAMTNFVSDNYGVIGGGSNNNAGNLNGDLADANYATVGGGLSNSAAHVYATVSGGRGNTASGPGAFVGGGGTNGVTHSGNTAGGSASVIGGGYNNITDAYAFYSAIGGGINNHTTEFYSTISGGQTNTASNKYASIGGGLGNTASGYGATIPGGLNNSATMSYTLAAGYRAKANHTGSFVWGDSTDANIASTATDQFVIRASNGVSFTKDAGESKSIAIGERYRDNAIIAWGDIASSGATSGAFGLASVAKATGIYTITLTATPSNSFTIVPVVTPEVDSPPTSAANARLVTVNITAANQFVVYITNGSYSLVDQQFLFIVTGR
jgi:trimeric autotransporter adhesin